MSQSRLAPETEGIVIGNHTPKYTARNPAIRWLTGRWVANLDRVFQRIANDRDGAPVRALEVGCGEGVIADKMQRRWGEVVALDLPDAGLRAEWRRHVPELRLNNELRRIRWVTLPELMVGDAPGLVLGQQQV